MNGSSLVADHVSDPGSICLIALINEDAVGYMCCTSDSYIYQILDVFVDKSFRRTGIGSEMMNQVKMMTFPNSSLEALIDVSDRVSSSFLHANQFTAVGVKADSVLMRFGWRFKHAPKVAFRGVKNA
jgi:GNAT superfamily N-acetyltransferase